MALGDLLITITGANVTKTAMVLMDLGEAYVSQHVALCRPVQSDMATYLYLWIVAPTAGRKVLEAAAYGAGKPGLNLDNIRQLQVALPPLVEQQRIVREADRLESTYDEVAHMAAVQLVRIGRLRQSILKWAFEGKLADQDPTDEPASVLLARIKAERDKTQPAKKKSRA